MKEAQDELKAKQAELQTTGKEIASLQVTLEKYALANLFYPGTLGIGRKLVNSV